MIAEMINTSEEIKRIVGRKSHTRIVFETYERYSFPTHKVPSQEDLDKGYYIYEDGSANAFLSTPIHKYDLSRRYYDATSEIVEIIEPCYLEVMYDYLNGILTLNVRRELPENDNIRERDRNPRVRENGEIEVNISYPNNLEMVSRGEHSQIGLFTKSAPDVTVQMEMKHGLYLRTRDEYYQYNDYEDIPLNPDQYLSVNVTIEEIFQHESYRENYFSVTRKRLEGSD